MRALRKNKLATVINGVGLTVAFACAILLMLRVYHEFSFDSVYPAAERTYKVYRSGNAPQGETRRARFPLPVTEAIKKEYAGVEKAALISDGAGTGIRYQDKTVNQEIKLVDADFLDVFSFPVLRGNRQSALTTTNNVVLTRRAAQSVFGIEDPVGKPVEVHINGKWIRLIVAAVLADLPQNTSIRFDVLARTELQPGYAEAKDRWDQTSSDLYIKLKASVTKEDFERAARSLVQKYYAEDLRFMKKEGYKPYPDGDYMRLHLLPVSELHFDLQVGAGDALNKSFLYVLLLVSCCILLIAGFNFVNLNIGVSFTRTKEIGIRKCLGAQKKQVWLQVWSESLFIISLSALMGTGLALLLIPPFNQLFGASVNGALLRQPVVIIVLVLLVLLMAFLASGYPSAIMARLKVTEVLKGKLHLKKNSVLRNALIVLQFVMAVILICATLVIYRQFQYLRKAPLGYDTDALISIPVNQTEADKNTVSKMRMLLASQPSVLSVSGSSINLGIGADGGTNKWTQGFEYNGRSLRTNILLADYDIIKTLGITLREGRDFLSQYASDTANNVIITQSMLAQLGIKDPVGRSIIADSSERPWTVIGVIPDFQLYSMYNKNEPLTIKMDPEEPVSYLLVRVITKNPSATMDMIRDAYRKIDPRSDFNGSYVTENVYRWYASEERLAKMFTAAAGVAILLSCMGLFGMAFIVVGQRTKEIGVRKVLGASVGNIATLVSKEFIKPVGIAILIALPIALWVLNKWLQHFTYRVSLTWWVFAAAGLLAVLIAVITVSVQAVRAAIVNPVKSLRTE
ncbi:ABC-type transport system, involved in lipoprotein release, permease component [Niabella drilacis]|uniref:ABC-type transport system, involved in lipoprotein release, permease component n=2 Tax=Niabella drilacis (strain DSM 25811 / CCM 8410 / CCUG 62505 / LMG 26954 / E90) TaxID=1285928 RepID=A0A1G7AIK2_NIADE|nr:ABC-type transport system, involved in lipoprotein release, permease component [Niabella drilacis]